MCSLSHFLWVLTWRWRQIKAENVPNTGVSEDGVKMEMDEDYDEDEDDEDMEEVS